MYVFSLILVQFNYTRETVYFISVIVVIYRVGQLIVDGMSKVLTTRWRMHMLDSTYLGFGPETDIKGKTHVVRPV